MPAAGTHSPMRRALLGGYRVSDVEVALASLELTLSQLKLELEGTKRRLAAAEARIADDRERPQPARYVEVEAAERVLRLEGDDAGRALDTARRLEQAEAEAARHREAVEEALRLRDRLAGAIRELAIDLGAERAPDAAAASGEALFETEVELDAGPFADLASLNAFEHALASLPAVDEVYVRGLESGRATIDVGLRAPTPLLQEMQARLPYLLDVESHDPRHLSLTVHPSAA